jgi:hypothetical protein
VTTLLQQLCRGQLAALLVEPDGRQRAGGPVPAAVLAGAFNPLHAGHLALAAVAARRLQAPVAFEMCVCNVDKAALTVAEAGGRLGQFAWKHPVWLTQAPTFAAKAGLFPGAVFVVGADTAERMLAPRYYQGGESGLREALESIGQQGCTFLVAARRLRAAALLRRADLAVPAEYEHLFAEIPPADFQMDLSSTELRQR